MAAKKKKIGYVQLIVRMGSVPTFAVHMDKSATVSPRNAKFHNSGVASENLALFREILGKLREYPSGIEVCIDPAKTGEEIRRKAECLAVKKKTAPKKKTAKKKKKSG